MWKAKNAQKPSSSETFSHARFHGIHTAFGYMMNIVQIKATIGCFRGM